MTQFIEVGTEFYNVDRISYAKLHPNNVLALEIEGHDAVHVRNPETIAAVLAVLRGSPVQPLAVIEKPMPELEESGLRLASATDDPPVETRVHGHDPPVEQKPKPHPPAKKPHSPKHR